MSRLTSQTPLSDTALPTASTFDGMFDDLETASAALNVNNTRDNAVDLPQYSSEQILRFAYDVTIGADDIDLTSNRTQTVMQTALPLAPDFVWVDDPTTTNSSFIYFGVSGLTFGADDVIRVSWHLNNEVLFSGTPYYDVGARGLIDLVDTGSAPIEVPDGLHCIPFYLEWDITDNTLTNWEPVIGQSNFQDVVGPTSPARVGANLEDCPAASFCPVWTSTTQGTDGGEIGSVIVYGRGWRTLRGNWAYQFTLGGDTIYGLRLVFVPTVYHPAYDTVTGKNCVVTDLVAANGVQLNYQGGRMTCTVIRGK